MKGFQHCYKHGGGKKKAQCFVSDCTTTSYTKGFCFKHGGGKKVCKTTGCTTLAQARSLYGGSKRKPCSVAD